MFTCWRDAVACECSPNHVYGQTKRVLTARITCGLLSGLVPSARVHVGLNEWEEGGWGRFSLIKFERLCWALA